MTTYATVVAAYGTHLTQELQKARLSAKARQEKYKPLMSNEEYIRMTVLNAQVIKHSYDHFFSYTKLLPSYIYITNSEKCTVHEKRGPWSQ